MERLNQRAFELLQAEIERIAGDDSVGKVQKEIALKRLNRLRSQSGKPATIDELRDLVDDLFPTFSEKVLKAAARANCPPKVSWTGVKVGVATVAGIVGGVWFLNLPYPPIRWPVARVAPMVLMPSFISMDHNYRQAIANTEQADQLVNNATSPSDLDVGKAKVQAAQKNLDALPVWFLGYYPQRYCSLFRCRWQFTFDEFQQARKEVARMDARLFQEMNAQQQFNQADQTVATAKQAYQEAANDAEREPAIAQWQAGIDLLRQLPNQTLAYKMAQPKLSAYERDFQQVVGAVAGNSRASNMVTAARAFDAEATKMQGNQPQSVAVWEEIIRLREQAIAELKQVSNDEPNYPQLKRMQAEYEGKLSAARYRLDEEKTAIKAYETANTLTGQLLETASRLDNAQIAGRLQAIEMALAKVKPSTTVFAEANQLRQQAAAKRKEAMR